MGEAADRSFDWVAALSMAAGGAVLLPSMAALVVTLIAVAASMF
jgi:hypothetical protein